MSALNIKKHWETLTDAIIRPPRSLYEIEDLGQPYFRLGKNRFARADFEVKNQKGESLQCSWWRPRTREELKNEEAEVRGERVEHAAKHKPRPCVIYCHGNCGCRRDAIEAVATLLPEGYTVFGFDFSGSGMSDGEYITLGLQEREDLAAVVAYLRQQEEVTTIGLWGRSMGAATSLRYVAVDPSIGGIVLDSPFSTLKGLALEIVENSKFKIPKFLVSAGLKLIKSSVKKRAGFNIEDVETESAAKASFTPALFAHAEGDDFVGPHHSERLCGMYNGDKNLVNFEGNHNSPRPQFFHDSVIFFFHNTLKGGVDDVEVPEEKDENRDSSDPEEVPAVDNTVGSPFADAMGIHSDVGAIEDFQLQQAMAMSLQSMAQEMSPTGPRETSFSGISPPDNCTLTQVAQLDEQAGEDILPEIEDDDEMFRRALELSLQEQNAPETGGAPEPSGPTETKRDDSEPLRGTKE